MTDKELDKALLIRIAVVADEAVRLQESIDDILDDVSGTGYPTMDNFYAADRGIGDVVRALSHEADALNEQIEHGEYDDSSR